MCARSRQPIFIYIYFRFIWQNAFKSEARDYKEHLNMMHGNVKDGVEWRIIYCELYLCSFNFASLSRRMKEINMKTYINIYTYYWGCVRQWERWAKIWKNRGRAVICLLTFILCPHIVGLVLWLIYRKFYVKFDIRHFSFTLPQHIYILIYSHLSNNVWW